MRRPARVAACACALVAAHAARAAGDSTPLTRGEYAARLRNLERGLRAGALEAAREDAASLRGARIAHGGRVVRADPSLLAPVLGRETLSPAAHAERVAAAARALEGTDAPAGDADPGLLARLADAQRPRTLPRGGRAGSLPRGAALPESTIDRVARAWRAAVDWLADWLRRLWPRRDPAGGERGVTGPVVALVAGVIAGLLFAAARTLRRTTRAPAAESRPDLESARDEDPLARDVSEWETRAAELARAGRYREAVRASYHAVLALLFRSGRLHYEKGRTNWEYAARIPAGTAWKVPFADLVRGFEREWYGHDRSTAEAWSTAAAHSRRLLEALSGAAPLRESR